MRFARVIDLFEYWKTTCPPLAEVAAAWAGWEPARDAVPQSPEERTANARLMGAHVMPAAALPPELRQVWDAHTAAETQRQTGTAVSRPIGSYARS